MEVEREKNKPTRKTKRKREKGNDMDTGKAVRSNIEGKSKKTKGKRKEDVGPSKRGRELLKTGETDQDEVRHLSPGNEGCSKGMKGSSKKARMKRKKDHNASKEAERSQEKGQEAVSYDVHQISSGDEDCSKGMKKWIMEYHQSRPGLKVLAQNIDDFIIAHEAQLELERKEREAQAAEGGFTVVVHHKGRKKTTEVGSGTTMGSVAKAVLENKMAKKKGKEVVKLDFYRFQRREAQRNEVMMLQSKFEQDKKRIQQLRATRKFRPY
ncbi:stress response protein NST1 isoform X2 [Fagus crenata]